VEINNDANYQVINKNGQPLSIRQSVGVSTQFYCTPSFIAQLQYLFISDVQKEAVLAVQVVPRGALDPTATPFTEVAIVTTINGNYTVPCSLPALRAKRDHGDDGHGTGAPYARSDCGDGHRHSDEECEYDYDEGCDNNCLCHHPGWTPHRNGGCDKLCGDGVIDAVEEECDSTRGCDDDCLCDHGWQPIPNPLNGTRNTSGNSNTTVYPWEGCKPSNPCPTYNCGANMVCQWDGVTPNVAVCVCASGYQPVTACLGRWGQNCKIICVDIDECGQSPGPCPSHLSCSNYDGGFTCT